MAKSKILIVEDQWSLANDLKTRLTGFGYSVPFITATGRQAIEYVKTEKIDLVLMDIVSKGKTDAIKTAKKIISVFDIPVIYLSACTDEAILKQAKKSGAYGYLVKPVNEREMQAAIELALYRHKIEKQRRANEEQLYTTLLSMNDAVTAANNSETKFRTLFNQASDSIFLLSFSPHGLIIEDTNDASLMMHGYSREELIGKSIEFLDDPDTAKYAKERARRLLQGETLSFEGRHVRKDGSVFPLDISTRLIYIGETPYVLAIDRDITERKQVEERLLKHKEQLEELVKERTRELSEANKNLKVEVNVRKLAEKKLLEYQKQLQLLTSQLSLIEENEKRRIAMELHDCIGQTLALSKIKLGLLNKSVQSQEMKRDIREILHLIEQTIKETRTLTFELSPPILYELGLSQAVKWLIDQFREKHGLDVELIDDEQDEPFSNHTRFFLFQAIRELLVNVVKHAQASRTKIIMRRDNEKLLIVLEDNGIGFSKTSASYEGYGLFNIRERMNHVKGRFEIKSTPGRGTRVTLAAPLSFDNDLTKRSQYENKDFISG